MNGIYRTYKIEDASGVLQYRAVVQGAAAGAVKKPTAVGAGKIIGITQEEQATQNKSVSVKRSGFSFAVAAGQIAVGDAVEIADTTGKLQSAQAKLEDLSEATAVVHHFVGLAETAAGADGDMFEVFIHPFSKLTPIS